MQLNIQFAKSVSTYFSITLALASEHPSFKEKDIGGQKLYSVSLGLDDIDLMDELLKLCGDWKSTTVRLDGKRVSDAQVRISLICLNSRSSCEMDDWRCKHCPRFLDHMEKVLTEEGERKDDNVIPFRRQLYPPK